MIDDIAQAKARSPMARQLCEGGNRQLMTDDADTVNCTMCDKELAVTEHVRNAGKTHPVVPSHLPDFAGKTRLEQRRLRGKRPWEQ